MTMREAGLVVAERERILREYHERSRDHRSEMHLASPASDFMHDRRNRVARSMLSRENALPHSGDACLEIGFGTLGWLSELLTWGVRESDLHGIELDAERARAAQRLLPAADLRIGDAAELPWKDDTFRLVIASTLFTSVLVDRVRRLIADEVVRVMAPGGALLWYDFAYNNPRNPSVRGIHRRELKSLFPTLGGKVKTITLAPPLTRFIAPRSQKVATLLEAVPFLRTHLIGVLIKRTP